MAEIEPKRILLVEDEAAIVMSETMVLEQHGFEVVAAFTGEKAIAAVDKDPKISLILMDIDLGKGMDGTRAAEIILQKHELPIVFLSSHTEPEIVQKTEGITSYGYIVKDSGDMVLITSIKMAFRLFEAKMQQKENEEQYRQLVEISPDFIGIIQDKKIVFINKAGVKLLGADTPEQLIGCDISEFIPSNEPVPSDEKWANFIKKGVKSTLIERQIKCFDGNDRILEIIGMPFRYKGKPAAQIIGRDITQRKKADNRLKESEQKFKSYIQNAPYAILVVDEKRKFIDINEMAEELTGYTRNELLKMDSIELTAEQDKQSAIKAFSNLIKNGNPITAEFRNIKKSGETCFWQIKAVKLSETRYLGFANDITERKLAEKQLAFQSQLLDQIQDAITATDLDGKITYVNEAECRLFQKSKEELGKQSVKQYGDDPLQGVTQEKIIETTRRSGRWRGEVANIAANGDKIIFDSRVQLIYDEFKKPIGMLGISTDITERKKAEEALKESEERYRSIFTNSKSNMLLIDPETGEIKDANSSALEFYGYTYNEITSLKINDLNILSEKELKEEMRNAVKGNKTYFIFRHKLANNQIKNVAVYSGKVEFNGKLLLYSIIHDISSQIEAEEKLQKALFENENLLKELQHRVKNSFLMITSMINLVKNSCETPGAKDKLEEIQTKINAVADIYNLLYSTKSINTIQLDHYLQKLISSFLATSSLIVIKDELDTITIPVNIAIPIGLIISELLTNSIKHAFPDGRNGRITIKLKKTKNGFKIMLSDNGVGLPENIDILSGKSLGLTLINALTSQIDANFTMKSDNGVKCVLTVSPTSN